MGIEGSFEEQKDSLGNYVKGIEFYLRLMAAFYPFNCNWLHAQVQALNTLSTIFSEIMFAKDNEELKMARFSLSSAVAIWPCMHAELICVYDHIKITFAEAENELQIPMVEMFSYFKPCSQNQKENTRFDCEEMLKKVAEVSGYNIHFHYK
jgi:hypothetical protein